MLIAQIHHISYLYVSVIFDEGMRRLHERRQGDVCCKKSLSGLCHRGEIDTVAVSHLIRVYFLHLIVHDQCITPSGFLHGEILQIIVSQPSLYITRVCQAHLGEISANCLHNSLPAKISMDGPLILVFHFLHLSFYDSIYSLFRSRQHGIYR